MKAIAKYNNFEIIQKHINMKQLYFSRIGNYHLKSKIKFRYIEINL